MALKCLVKVGEITNLSDARYCAGMGVDMLGFNLNPADESFTSPETFKEITDWVAGVKFVAEMPVDQSDDLRAGLDKYEIDLVQVSIRSINKFDDVPYPMVVCFERGDEIARYSKDIESRKDRIHYCLLEHFEMASDFSDHFDTPILISDGFDASDVLGKLNSYGVEGIALKGGIESKPGFKDYDELADILEALETDD